MIFTCSKKNYKPCNENEFKTIAFPARINFKTQNEWGYISKYYDEILKKLDPEETYKILNDSIIIDDNKIDRLIISAWLELMLNKKIPEILVYHQKIIKTNKPDYIKDYLENYIKSQIDMKGFHYLHYWYLSLKNQEILNINCSKRKI